MIEALNKDTITDCYILAEKLWPGLEKGEFIQELMDSLVDEDQVCFLYSYDKRPVAFAQGSVRRDYVEGSDSSPVAYVEGVYCLDNHRKSGIGRQLIAAIEEWGRTKGFSQIGSDCELDNLLSIDFHKAIGFTEANRTVSFIKDLKNEA